MTKGKKIVISILIVVLPLLIGGMTSSNSKEVYSGLVLPSFAPPGWLFGIVWPILYIFMGVSFYLILESVGDKKEALKWFVVQLALNIMWPILFFQMGNYMVALGVLFFLWATILKMMLEIYEINPKAAYLQIPYLLWVTFALALNFAIVNL